MTPQLLAWQTSTDRTCPCMHGIQGPFREGVARIFDRVCDATPQHSRSEPRSRARPHTLWLQAHRPPHRRAARRVRGCERHREITAQTHDQRQRACAAHRALRASALSPPLAHRPCWTFGCVSTLSMQIMTVPGLLNLPVPRPPRGSTGGTAGLAGVPRIGWDRLRRRPARQREDTCRASASQEGEAVTRSSLLIE